MLENHSLMEKWMRCSDWLMPLKKQSTPKVRYQLWRLQVLAQPRMETQQQSQCFPEVAQPEVEALEAEVSAVVIAAAVVVVVKANRKARRQCQRDHAHNTEGMGERHSTAWM